jgi:hypothetical protein
VDSETNFNLQGERFFSSPRCTAKINKVLYFAYRNPPPSVSFGRYQICRTAIKYKTFSRDGAPLLRIELFFEKTIEHLHIRIAEQTPKMVEAIMF